VVRNHDLVPLAPAGLDSGVTHQTPHAGLTSKLMSLPSEDIVGRSASEVRSGVPSSADADQSEAAWIEWRRRRAAARQRRSERVAQTPAEILQSLQLNLVARRQMAEEQIDQVASPSSSVQEVAGRQRSVVPQQGPSARAQQGPVHGTDCPLWLEWLVHRQVRSIDGSRTAQVRARLLQAMQDRAHGVATDCSCTRTPSESESRCCSSTSSGSFESASHLCSLEPHTGDEPPGNQVDVSSENSLAQDAYTFPSASDVAPVSVPASIYTCLPWFPSASTAHTRTQVTKKRIIVSL